MLHLSLPLSDSLSMVAFHGINMNDVSLSLTNSRVQYIHVMYLYTGLGRSSFPRLRDPAFRPPLAAGGEGEFTQPWNRTFAEP